MLGSIRWWIESALFELRVKRQLTYASVSRVTAANALRSSKSGRVLSGQHKMRAAIDLLNFNDRDIFGLSSAKFRNLTIQLPSPLTLPLFPVKFSLVSTFLLGSNLRFSSQVLHQA